MKKLRLPIIRHSLPEPKPLSMDAYVRFVELYVKSVLNREAYEQTKKERAVTAPFFLKKR